jgi:hypothetical protein
MIKDLKKKLKERYFLALCGSRQEVLVKAQKYVQIGEY